MLNLKNFSIRVKIISGFGVTILMFLFFAIYLLSELSVLKSEALHLKEKTTKQALLSEDIKNSVTQVWQFISDASATGEDDGLEAARKWAENYRKYSKEYEILVDNGSPSVSSGRDMSFENL